jgi:hypothetical protein
MNEDERDMEEEDEEQVPQQVADLAEASVPNSLKGVRACKRCGILKTLDQFIDNGCENCPFLDMVSKKKPRLRCRWRNRSMHFFDVTICSQHDKHDIF